MKQPVNHAGCKGGAAAAAVYQANVIVTALAEIFTIVAQNGPAVIRCGVAFPQSAANKSASVNFSDLLKHLAISFNIQLTGKYVSPCRLESKAAFGILLIADAHIHVAHDLFHKFLCIFYRPKLAAIVEVA